MRQARKQVAHPAWRGRPNGESDALRGIISLLSPLSSSTSKLLTSRPGHLPDAMIDLDDVSKSYGAVRALQSISLHVAPEKTTVLIGPSGCGKSTILRLIIGLIQPDRGRVLFEGTHLTPQNVRGLRLKMGYVIQEGGLFPHMTARENVTLMARHLGYDAVRIDDRVDELTDLVRLPAERLRDYPAQLSGGQRQRVSLMRALALDPDVLLMDEPLGALDPMIRADLQDDLRTIFRKLGKTVVLVTHDVGEAVFFADRIVLLRQGTIIQEGSPKELINEPSDPFVDDFIRAQRPPLAIEEEERA